VPDEVSTHNIPGVGSVTLEVKSGQLILVDVSAPGWDIARNKVESDKIEIEFRSNEAEAEFEAELDHGRVEVDFEVEVKSD
jgi:hypothetical protein